MSGFRHRLFAWILKKGEKINDQVYRSFKEELFKDVHGTVVEIGPGTGINLRYLPAGIDWIGLEPNDAFYSTIQQTAGNRNIKVKLKSASAEHIPLPDESADAVICTLVLCTVPDQSGVLQEIKRVLKKGGKFYFIEHVADKPGTFRRKAQDFCNPVNRFMADGCNCNRETWTQIENAGFSSVIYHHEMIRGAMALHAPHIIGYAQK